MTHLKLQKLQKDDHPPAHCLSVNVLLSNIIFFVIFAVLDVSFAVNPLTGTLKPQSSGPLYSNMVIGTLAVDGWAVTFGTARRGMGGLEPRPVPSSLYQM